jgi:hypothetical protein
MGGAQRRAELHRGACVASCARRATATATAPSATAARPTCARASPTAAPAAALRAPQRRRRLRRGRLSRGELQRRLRQLQRQRGDGCETNSASTCALRRLRSTCALPNAGRPCCDGGSELSGVQPGLRGLQRRSRRLRDQPALQQPTAAQCGRAAPRAPRARAGRARQRVRAGHDLLQRELRDLRATCATAAAAATRARAAALRGGVLRDPGRPTTLRRRQAIELIRDAAATTLGNQRRRQPRAHPVVRIRGHGRVLPLHIPGRRGSWSTPTPSAAPSTRCCTSRASAARR